MPRTSLTRSRLTLLVVLALATSVALFVHAMLYLHASFLDGRKLAAQHVVEIAHKLLVNNYGLEASGQLSRAEAQTASLAAIRTLRYGNNDYFWINDMHPTMVMHPTMPELNGQDMSEIRDVTGKPLFLAFVAMVRANGGGFIAYQWPKPKQNEAVNKISYVKGFEPWGWIIGSGIYLDDIEAEFRKEFLQNAGLLLLLAIVLAFVARKIHLNGKVAQTLLASEAQLRQIMEHLPVAALVASRERIFLINQKLTELLGFDAKDLATLDDLWRLAFPDPAHRAVATAAWRQQVAQTLQNAANSSAPQEYHVTAKDGRQHTVEVSYCQTKEWAVAAFYDLTERRAAEAHQRLTLRVFETTGEAIMVTDTEAKIVAVNPAFCGITGYSPDEVVGQNPKILSSGRHSSNFHQAMWRALRETGEWQGEVWNRRKNGEVFPEWQTLSSVRDTEGRVTNYVSVFADLSEIRRAQETAEHLSWRDALTGLANRALFFRRVEQKLKAALRQAKHSAVLLIDLDRFKDINEARGMPFGDALLKRVAECFTGVLEADATLARLGSDEFAVLLPHLSDSNEAAGRLALELAEELQALLRGNVVMDGEAIHMDASIGIAVFPLAREGTATDILRQVDIAMHRAKSEGGARAVFFESAMGETVMERHRMEGELRTAVSDGQLRLYLQPQVNAAGVQVGAEALVRWQHPTRGIVAPGAFIPLAESSDLIVAIDRWMLAQVCHLLVRLEEAGSTLKISVNISPRHFKEEDFVADVIRQLDATGADPARLMLEITEGLVIGDVADVVSKMDALRTLGIHFSMDDFGTGYSSLAHLKRLPIQELKIDRSFITDVTTDPNDAAIVETILSIARHMHLQVVAEGVETQAQADFLNSRGDAIHQGYFFARPMPAETWLMWAPEASVCDLVGAGPCTPQGD